MYGRPFSRLTFTMMASAWLSACGAGTEAPLPEGSSAPPPEAAVSPLVSGAADTESELARVAQAFLEDRNQNLLDGTVGSSAPTVAGLSASLSARAAQDNAALRELRDTLSRLGERYTGVKTGTRLLEVRQAGGETIARVEETSYLEYARVRGDEPPYTAFRVEREFTFSQQDGALVLEDVRLLNPDGLAPINEVVRAPENPLAERLPAPAGVAELSRFSLAPGHAPGVKGMEPGAGLASYNYSAMVNYAVTWAYGRNPSYRSFPNDCTNFISQAMYAGGWTMVEGWYQSNSSWWYTFANQSYPWAGAHNWYFFATGSGRTTTLSNVWNMALADVLQMDFERDNNINHTMIVTQTSGSERYLTYHTTDTLNRSLSSLISAYPSAWYYAHRT
jgi:hypothetical protein